MGAMSALAAILIVFVILYIYKQTNADENIGVQGVQTR